MAATFQHSCNRLSDTDLIIFRNDANNVAALESARAQKRRMEEAARQQELKLNEHVEEKEKVILERNQLRRDKENVMLERNQLLTDKDDLARTIEQKDTEIGNLRKVQKENDGLALTIEQKDKEIENLKTVQNQRDELALTLKEKDKEIENLKALQKQARDDYDDSNRLLEDQTRTIVDLKKKTQDGALDNCLPLQFHNATVMIINAGSTMALDAGKDGCTKVHGWSYDFSNQNQQFKLSKVENNLRPDAHWIISRSDSGQQLYFPNGNNDLDVHVGNNIPDKQGFWSIGRDVNNFQATWKIKSAQWNTNIRLQSLSKADGIGAKSQFNADDWDAHWFIILVRLENQWT